MSKLHEKVVVVGAGMAGLTAAAYLAKAGYQVMLLEKNDRTGGLLGTINKNGFQFDSGPRAFVNSGIVKPMLRDLGAEWNFLENKISIGIENQLLQINSLDDLDQYQHMLETLYPESKADIVKILAAIRELSESTKVIYDFDNPGFGAPLNDKEYVFKKLLPWTFKFLQSLRKFDHYKMPVEGFLQKLSDNHSLIDILTQHFFRNTPSYFALGYFYVYQDYFYPKGGTGMLKDLVEQKITEAGGQIKLNTQVSQVLPSASKVVDSSGCEYPYDYLVWAADLKALYNAIDTAGLAARVESKVAAEKKSVLSSKGAESVFMMYLGVNRPPEYFKEHGGEHFFYTPSRQGLGEVNKAQRLRIIEHFDQVTKEEVMAWVEQYCALNTYEISIPVLRDSTLAPEGQTGVMISCLLEYPVIKNIEKAGWLDEFKVRFERQVLSSLSGTIFQNIEKDVLFSFAYTPLTIHRVFGISDGAIVGWSFDTEPPVEYKLTALGKSVFTAIPNIYKAGQWAYAPAGVPTAMLTGWHASQKIIKQSKKKR